MKNNVIYVDFTSKRKMAKIKAPKISFFKKIKMYFMKCKVKSQSKVININKYNNFSNRRAL